MTDKNAAERPTGPDDPASDGAAAHPFGAPLRNVGSGSEGARPVAGDRRGATIDALGGVFFDIPELEWLISARLPDLRVEIVPDATRYEELVVFRLSALPSVVVATLHKTPSGRFALTGIDRTDPRGAPSCRRHLSTLDALAPALRRLLAR